MAVTLRATKGSALSHTELDANFTDLMGGAGTADEVRAADGAGDGSYKKIYTQGWYDYNDVATTSTPIPLTAAGTFYDLTNDGAGANTNDTYKLPNAGAIWNTTSNQFEWDTAGLSVGDTVDIRFDFDIVNSGANGEFVMNMDMAHGHASEFALGIHRVGVKSAGTINVVRWWSCYMGSQDVLDNPAKLAMSSDSTGDTIIVNGWYVRVTPRNPVLD